MCTNLNHHTFKRSFRMEIIDKISDSNINFWYHILDYPGHLYFRFDVSQMMWCITLQGHRMIHARTKPVNQCHKHHQIIHILLDLHVESSENYHIQDFNIFTPNNIWEPNPCQVLNSPPYLPHGARWIQIWLSTNRAKLEFLKEIHIISNFDLSRWTQHNRFQPSNVWLCIMSYDDAEVSHFI